MATISPSNHAAALRLLDEYSLEMTGKDVDGLRAASGSIPAGTRVNITFLGNEDLEMRVTAARAVRELGFEPVPHISARRLASEAELEEYLDRLHEIGASDHVFAVGGDPTEPLGPYPDALSMIESGLFTKHGVREVSIAGYPEGHPDIASDTLWEHLEKKSSALQQQGLGSVIITQFAFDTDPVISWIENVRSRGIDSEIRVGTPGPAGVKRLISFATRFGIGANAMIVKKYGFSLTNLIGTAGPDRFVNDLAQRLESSPAGDVSLHFYTFGGLQATSEWARGFTAAN